MAELVGASITLIANLAGIIAKAVADKNASVAQVKAECAAEVQRFTDTLSAMPDVLTANDTAADEAAKTP